MLTLLSACGSSTPAPDAVPSSRARSSPASSAQGDCGEVVLRQGEMLEAVGARERACLEDALADGRSATLTVTAPTVEGDPVTTTWAVAADGTLSADSDVSRDRFADPSADYRVICGRVTTLPRPLECPPVE